MKLTFLGTGAGEGYPGYWCRCPHCTYARTAGGRNLRTNSCAVIDETLLLDIGPACFDNAARFGLDLSQIQGLLITHPHEDHLYPQHLYWRDTDEENLSLHYREMLYHGAPRFTPIPELEVFGNAYAIDTIQKTFEVKPTHRMAFYTVHEGVPFEACGFRVTPVRGNHGPAAGFAHSYVLEKDGKTLLYALDSGTYDDDQMAILYGFCFDAVIMEGTTGLTEQYGGHMCLVNNIRLRQTFLETGCMREDSRFYLTHLSPHWCPPYDMYAPMTAAEGMVLAYDGMQIEI